MDKSICYWCEDHVQDCTCDLGLTPPTEKEYCVCCDRFGTTHQRDSFICQQCLDVQALDVPRHQKDDDDYIAYLTRWAD